MKTIEERAKEAYPVEEHNVFTELKVNAYIQGAKEQKAIDEEVRLKKCDDMTEAEYNRETAFVDWYLENGKGMPAYSDAIEWARKAMINKACEWLKENAWSFAHAFDGEPYYDTEMMIKALETAMEE